MVEYINKCKGWIKELLQFIDDNPHSSNNIGTLENRVRGHFVLVSRHVCGKLEHYIYNRKAENIIANIRYRGKRIVRYRPSSYFAGAFKDTGVPSDNLSFYRNEVAAEAQLMNSRFQHLVVKEQVKKDLAKLGLSRTKIAVTGDLPGRLSNPQNSNLVSECLHEMGYSKPEAFIILHQLHKSPPEDILALILLNNSVVNLDDLRALDKICDVKALIKEGYPDIEDELVKAIDSSDEMYVLNTRVQPPVATWHLANAITADDLYELNEGIQSEIF